VGVIGSQVDEIAEGIEKNIAQPIEELTVTTRQAASAADSAASAADSATSSADTAAYEAEHVQRLVGDLQEVIEELQDESLQNLAYRVIRLRRKVWWNFTVDTWEHASSRADRLEVRLRELLAHDVSLDAARNSWEMRVWQDLLKDRGDRRRSNGSSAAADRGG
jgi:hypothetical protein